MHPRVILSVGNFFFSIFSALVSIILFPYLAQFLSPGDIGFVIAGGAVLAVACFPYLPQMVERFGAQKIALCLALVELVVLFGMAAIPEPIPSIALMLLTIAMQPFLFFQFDLLIEATIADTNTTGRVRALFRTAWNAAALGAPLLLGALLATSNSYGRVFLAAAAMLLPIILILALKELPQGPPPEYMRMRDTLERIEKNRDLTAVTFNNLLLYLFYVWMPLYTPLYLHNVLGFSWAELGWVFAVMLIPYAVLEYPAGWIADRILGDKELMFVGFLIAGASMAALSLVTSTTSIQIILLILVCSRIGAALVEAMVDAHFFRRVSSRDINTVSVFRSVWPLSYIIGPMVGSIILFTADYATLFLITGGIVGILGMITTLCIVDFQ